MVKNRIKVKEFSELLAKEVENGNGDAFMFVGEYYITNNNWSEERTDINGIKKITENTTPYNIYMDNTIKEKIMALSYIHVQKLTDEENAELMKQLEEKDKKSKAKSKSYSYEYRPYGTDRYGTAYGADRYDDMYAPRVGIREEEVNVANADNGNPYEFLVPNQAQDINQPIAPAAQVVEPALIDMLEPVMEEQPVAPRSGMFNRTATLLNELSDIITNRGLNQFYMTTINNLQARLSNETAEEVFLDARLIDTIVRR